MGSEHKTVFLLAKLVWLLKFGIRSLNSKAYDRKYSNYWSRTVVNKSIQQPQAPKAQSEFSLNIGYYLYWRGDELITVFVPLELAFLRAPQVRWPIQAVSILLLLGLSSFFSGLSGIIFLANLMCFLRTCLPWGNHSLRSSYYFFSLLSTQDTQEMKTFSVGWRAR